MKKKTNLLPDDWVWVHNNDDTGRLEQRVNKGEPIAYFHYDKFPFSTQARIRYKARGGKAWDVFLGNFRNFKKFAEEYILNNVINGPKRLTERTDNGIVGNNDAVSGYPLYNIYNDIEFLDGGLLKECFEKLAAYEDIGSVEGFKSLTKNSSNQKGELINYGQY